MMMHNDQVMPTLELSEKPTTTHATENHTTTTNGGVGKRNILTA